MIKSASVPTIRADRVKTNTLQGIPGYRGYVPGKKSETVYGKSLMVLLLDLCLIGYLDFALFNRLVILLVCSCITWFAA